METVTCTLPLEYLDAITRTGKEPDTWSGTRLLEAINETRLILLLDFPRRENWRGDRLCSVSIPRREIWFVTRRSAVTEAMTNLPSVFDKEDSLEPTAWASIGEGQEWYTAVKYHLGHNNRFMSCGFGQLPIATLSAWIGSELVDMTTDFDEALNFLTA